MSDQPDPFERRAPASAAGLAHQVETLSARSEQLRDAVDQLRVRQARTERISLRTAVAGVILTVLLLVLGYVAAQQAQQRDEIDTITQHALCPLYALILGSYTPESRPLNPDGTYPGSAREKYDLGFAEMRREREALPCTDELIPPRQGG